MASGIPSQQAFTRTSVIKKGATEDKTLKSTEKSNDCGLKTSTVKYSTVQTVEVNKAELHAIHSVCHAQDKNHNWIHFT